MERRYQSYDTSKLDSAGNHGVIGFPAGISAARSLVGVAIVAAVIILGWSHYGDSPVEIPEAVLEPGASPRQASALLPDVTRDRPAIEVPRKERPADATAR